MRRKHAERVIRSGKPVLFEERREGVFLESYVYPVFNREGKVYRLAIFSHNVTELKHHEETIRRQHEELTRRGALLDGLIENAGNVIFISELSAGGQPEYFHLNQAAKKLYGFEGRKQVTRTELIANSVPLKGETKRGAV